MIRGTLALAIIFASFVIGEIFQRLILAPYVSLRSNRRVPALARWQHFMAAFVHRVVMLIAGARAPIPQAVVPTGPGHLILMNHQSVFDITVMILLVSAGYPRIVTRQRYGRFIPLISHMARLYQYPFVDPRATREQLRESLDQLEEAARTSDVPIGLFPEGTRTKDGEIKSFKLGALARILRSRAWTVHLVVTDGYWNAAKMKGIAGSLGSIRGSTRYLGSIEWTDPNGDPAAFAEEARARMIEGLAELRAETAAA